MTAFPTVITHNFHSERGAFKNICSLPRPEAEVILDEIRATGTRNIKANYLTRRHAVESWLIRESKKKVNAITLSRPIYFFLGDFADGKDSSRPQSCVIPLHYFPQDVLTFTYPDSMASLPIALEDKHLPHRREYHGQVFTLEEIQAVVAEHGLPNDRWKHDPARQYDRFIEVQVWNDAPIKRFLRDSNNPLSLSM